MNEQDSKTNTERIINISNIYNIKHNSYNDNYTYIKSMNNSISSQKIITQNSTCSSNLKSNKTFSNEDNIITGYKPIRRGSNETLLKNLCVSSFSIKSNQNIYNLKTLVYKKKQVNNFTSIKGTNNINTIRNKKGISMKKINLINDEFSKKINSKGKKEFHDLTLDEYLKEQIKNMSKKTYNNKENNQKSLNKTNNQTDSQINKENDNKKSLLSNYITYNNFTNIPNKDKTKQNKIKQKLCSKISYINLPKPKIKSKNKKLSTLNSTGKTFGINSNKKINTNTFNHRKFNSFDGSFKNLFKNEKNTINLKNGKSKIKIINLQIDLSDLIGEEKNSPKKKFRFSRSTKKLNEKININNFTKDFFIVPKFNKL